MFYILSVSLYIIPSWLNLIAHKEIKSIARTLRVIYGNLQQTAVARVHCGVPKLVRVHLAQTFISLDIRAFFGIFFNLI